MLKSLTEFRVEVTQKLESLTVRMGDFLSVARRTIGILTPVIVTLIGSLRADVVCRQARFANGTGRKLSLRERRTQALSVADHAETRAMRAGENGDIAHFVLMKSLYPPSD